jgi:hypothetical protein
MQVVDIRRILALRKSGHSRSNLRETRGEAVCLGLHPGTVDTHLSLPFQRGVRADALFSPDFAAARLLSVMDGLTADLSGRIFAWDGQEIPP